MVNQPIDSLRESLNLDEILELIDLSQINIVPTVKLWTKAPTTYDVLSDVSSSDTGKRSTISVCSDSVSAMTVSESDDSIMSLDNLEGEKKTTTYQGTELDDLHPPVSEGDLLDIEEHISSLVLYKSKLSFVFKYLLKQSRFNVESILKESFEVFTKVHSTVCILSSVDYISRNSEEIKKVSFNRLVEIFKELYTELISFLTHILKQLSTEISENVASMFLELIPYLLDTLLCILIVLLQYLDENEKKDNLVEILGQILKYCVILCCSYLDHNLEDLNRMSMLTIYRLTQIFLPLDLVYTVDDNNDEQGDSDKGHLTELVENLREEYLEQEFKPSSVVLFKLRSEEYANESNNQLELHLLKVGIECLETCIRTGVTRRSYPTAHIDTIGCFELMSKVTLATLWSRLNFWLLQRLESVNSKVRKIALLILKHALCTIAFIERDRQYIMTYVQNLLSEDETIGECLSLIRSVSFIYPLKDGAVKKIANLTLKGSRKQVKMKVLDILGRCRYTVKGLSFLISVFQSISQYSEDPLSFANMDPGDLSSVKHYSTNLQLDLLKIVELKFTLNEWPKIIKALVSLSKSHKNIASSVNVPCDLMPYIGLKSLAKIPANMWIALLWSYLTKNTEEMSTVYRFLWFSEAKIRFPTLVKSIPEEDSEKIEKCSKVLRDFIDLGTEGKEEITPEYIKDPSNWKVINELRVPFQIDHFEKEKIVFEDKYTLIDTNDGGKGKSKNKNKEGKEAEKEDNQVFPEKCNCIDCRIEAKILKSNKDEKNKMDKDGDDEEQGDSETFDPLVEIFEEFGDCKIYKEKTKEEEEFELFSSISNPNKSEQSKYAFALSRFKTSTLDVEVDNLEIDNVEINPEDVDCYEFPAPLGCQISFQFRIKSTQEPSDLDFYYKLPYIANYSYRSNLKRKESQSSVFSESNGFLSKENEMSCDQKEDSSRRTLLGPGYNLLKPAFSSYDVKKNLYQGSVTFGLNFPFPTTVAVPLEFFYSRGTAIRKFGMVWIHPKRVMS